MKRYLLSYDEAVTLTLGVDAPFYESKFVVEGYDISIFNYRLASFNDFVRNVVEIESNDGILIKIKGDIILDGKLIKDMTDDELILIGFENLSKFKI
jgi:hypothetical protein